MMFFVMFRQHFVGTRPPPARPQWVHGVVHCSLTSHARNDVFSMKLASIIALVSFSTFLKEVVRK